MIATAITFALSHRRLLAALGITLAVLSLVLGIYLKGRHDAAEKAEARRKVEVAAAIKSDARADEKSTAQLERDAERIAKDKEDLIDVVAATPDGVPDAASVELGCRVLRQSGRNVADIPACRNTSSGQGARSPG